MISAKLLKDLERFGFELEFPGYSSNENRIFEILKENNQRLYLAIPLLLQHPIDYDLIISKLSLLKGEHATSLISQLNKLLIITNKIFMLEGIANRHILNIIALHSIKEEITEDEFKYYYDSFKGFSKKTAGAHESDFKENIRIRGKLNTNQSLYAVFSPAKLKIMEKIFQHEKLTNTELKYYYKSIRPLIHAILNENMRQYLGIVDSLKKRHY